MAAPSAVAVAVALGSNVGDRHAHLRFGVVRLAQLFTDLQVSTWYDTAPVAVEPQPRFLNGAVTGKTTLPAQALLDHLLRIERERGRERPARGAPRTLDLDLILYGALVNREPGLWIPHPRFRERLFVLEPLAEIAGQWVDPETGSTISTLLSARRLLEAGPS